MRSKCCQGTESDFSLLPAIMLSSLHYGNMFTRLCTLSLRCWVFLFFSFFLMMLLLWVNTTFLSKPRLVWKRLTNQIHKGVMFCGVPHTALLTSSSPASGCIWCSRICMKIRRRSWTFSFFSPAHPTPPRPSWLCAVQSDNLKWWPNLHGLFCMGKYFEVLNLTECNDALMGWFIIQSCPRGCWLLEWWHCICAGARVNTHAHILSHSSPLAVHMWVIFCKLPLK